MNSVDACRCIEEQGYCVLPDVLSPEEAESLDQQARSLMSHDTGYVKLEGALRQIPTLAPLCTRPIIMEIATHFWGTPFYLANNACMMWCQPGSPSGSLHSDWPLGDVPLPYPDWPMLLQTMWMLTDFTEDNGATRIVPGTHRAGKPPERDQDHSEIPVLGKQGSVLVWHGALWHRNGANHSTDRHRMGANIAYIPKFVHRPPNAWPLVERTLYRNFPAHLQALLERSVKDE